MNYYERHLGDYARDTAHLSMLEHGAYTLLLDRYYATEQPLPADQIHRLARARSRDERAAVDAVLAEFFTLSDGLWHHKRADHEVEKANIRIAAAKQNGTKGGRPRKPKETQQKPGGFSVGSENETQSKALHTPNPIHQTPEVFADANTPPAKPASIRAAALIDLGVPEQVATAYLHVRKTKRGGPLTELALAGIQREAVKAGLTLAQALTKCVERSWVGFEADWVARSAPAGGSTLLDHNRAAFEKSIKLLEGKGHA